MIGVFYVKIKQRFRPFLQGKTPDGCAMIASLMEALRRALTSLPGVEWAAGWMNTIRPGVHKRKYREEGEVRHDAEEEVCQACAREP